MSDVAASAYVHLHPPPAMEGDPLSKVRRPQRGVAVTGSVVGVLVLVMVLVVVVITTMMI